MQGTTPHSSLRNPSHARRRRGSVIILAVAVLAVLAISAASYVTITRLDRSSAASYSRQTGFLQQRDAVVGQLRALIAADLFGNKVVDTSTPRQFAGRDVWPRRFEDGEHWDAPTVVPGIGVSGLGLERFTFDTRSTADQELNVQVTPRARLAWADDLAGDGMYEAAWPDDAWLSSAEPFDLQPALVGDAWDTWPQITNLRSEYRWNDQDQWWERLDGRYIDLANFFLSAEANRLNRGDPGADLTILSEEGIPDLAIRPPELAGPRAMFDQPVYHLQMNHMEEARITGDYTGFNADLFTIDDAPFQQVDMRMWADTDGDGRPDARWQELDALGSSQGLRWIVAARTIDASSMVNVNASIEWGDSSDASSVGSGTTPADIDLRRLIETSSRLTGAPFGGADELRHPDVGQVQAAEFQGHFNAHLLDGLNLGATNASAQPVRDGAILKLIEDKTDPPYSTWKAAFDARGVDSWLQSGGELLLNGQTSLEFTTRAQREAYYRFVGSSFDLSTVEGRRGYPWSDAERELRTFWGFNDPIGVSSLEARFDGPQSEPYNRLPGSGAIYPDDANSLGPMRSAEQVDVPRTFDNIATLPGLTGTYTQREKVTRIENDVRRLLTTYNGSGFISPQPGWTVAAGGDRLWLNAAPDPLLRLTDAVTYERQMRQFLSKATGGFMWALAPLATDRPVMRAGRIGNPRNLAEVVDSGAHYGGWDNGPASVIEAGAAGGPGGPAGPSGAYIALRTSAALAVNLADAIDDEGFEPTPTIMRVAKNYEVEQALNGGRRFGQPLPAGATINDGIVEVGVDFDHGRLPIGIGGEFSNLDALPRDTSGSTDLWFPSSNDMVLVGLDRQPFLREAGTLAMFGDGYNVGSSPFYQVLNVTKDQAGLKAWLFAIEIGNPWPDPIELSDYTLVLTDGTNTLEMALDGVIVPEGDAVVAWVQNVEDGLFQEAWDDARDEWESTIADNLKLQELDIGALGATTLADFAGAGTQTPTLLLRRTVQGGGGVNHEVLLDRLSPPDRAQPFPFGDRGDQTIDPTLTGTFISIDGNEIATGLRVGQTYIGAFLDGASMQRPTESNSGTGAPAYLIERSDQNLVAPMGGDDTDFAVWTTEVIGVNAALGGSRPHNATLGGPKSSFADDPVPSFQLFVPDGPLLSPSELLQLTAYAHTFKPNILDPYSFGVDDLKEWDTNRSWQTVSEQLGEAAAMAYDGGGAVGAGNQNPFFGALDFSRGILASTDPVVGLDAWTGPNVDPNDVPQELRVPLALRVLDAFETLGSIGPIAQGRININTAPDRVLRVLPLVDPRQVTSNYGPTYPNLGGWTTTATAAQNRIDTILEYRERRAAYRSPIDGNALNRLPHQITQPGLPGLREDNTQLGHYADQFVSLGELALLHSWDSSRGVPNDPANAGFAEVGVDGARQRTPIADPLVQATDEAAIDIRPSIDLFDGDDDLEERLALVRAVTAVTSTRSDVFVTWFVIRGYAPAAIEAIPIPDNVTNNDDRAALLNDLEPTHESRWLVVLDRSNVRQATDRPEIILLTELPTTSP